MDDLVRSGVALFIILLAASVVYSFLLLVGKERPRFHRMSRWFFLPVLVALMGATFALFLRIGPADDSGFESTDGPAQADADINGRASQVPVRGKWKDLWDDAMSDPAFSADLAGWAPVMVVRGLDFEIDIPHRLHEKPDGIGKEDVIRVPGSGAPERGMVQWVQQSQKEGFAMAAYDADTWDLQGRHLVILGRLRTQGVRRMAGPDSLIWMWGGKFYLQFNSAGEKYWEAANTIDRDHPWHVRVLEQDRHVSKPGDDVPVAGTSRLHEYIIRMPDDARDCWLHLGFQNASGQAWFDDIAIFEVHPSVE